MAPAAADAYFGARFSLYPMTDRFVPVILEALKALPDAGLEVETDDVSTFLGGHPDTVFGALEGAFARAAASGEHVVMTVLLSRGCPGEEVCDPAAAGPAPEASAAPLPALPARRVACQWSLYPLGVPGYMDVIYREIKRTKEAGVFTRGQHFVSRLDGNLHDVLATVRRAFDGAGADAGHVVAHVTLAANSPSAHPSAPGSAGAPGAAR